MQGNSGTLGVKQAREVSSIGQDSRGIQNINENRETPMMSGLFSKATLEKWNLPVRHENRRA